MAYTDKKRASNLKWDKAHLDRMSIALPSGTKDRVQRAADDAGQSVNGWLKGIIMEKLERLDGN